MPDIPKAERTKTGTSLISIPQSAAAETVARARATTGQAIAGVGQLAGQVVTDLQRRQKAVQDERTKVSAMIAATEDYKALSGKYQEAMFKNAPDHEYMPGGKDTAGPAMTASQWFANEASKIKDTRTAGMTEEQRGIYLGRLNNAEVTYGMNIAKRQFKHLAAARLDNVQDTVDVWAAEARVHNIEITMAKLHEDDTGMSQLDRLVVDSGLKGEQAEALMEHMEEYLVSNAIIGMSDRTPAAAIKYMRAPGDPDDPSKKPMSSYFHTTGNVTAVDKMDNIEKRILDRKARREKIAKSDQKRVQVDVVNKASQRAFGVTQGIPGSDPYMNEDKEADVQKYNIDADGEKALSKIVESQGKFMKEDAKAEALTDFTARIYQEEVTETDIINSGIDSKDWETARRINNSIHKEDNTVLKRVMKDLDADHEAELFGKGGPGTIEYYKQIKALQKWTAEGKDPDEFYAKTIQPFVDQGFWDLAFTKPETARLRRLEIDAKRKDMIDVETFRNLPENKGINDTDLIRRYALQVNEIKSTSAAVDFLMTSEGLSRDQAIEWIRSQ